MRDPLHEPLGRRPRRAPGSGRLAVVARSTALGLAAAIMLGGGAVGWRAMQPRAPEVAAIAFDAIKTVAPAPAAPAPVASAAATVFPPPAETSTASRSGATSGSSPQIIDVAEALGRRPPQAVVARLTEASRFGLLPRVGSDGAKPADLYARPYADTAITRDSPRIAVIVGGLGLDRATTDAAVARLPAAVSLGIAPYGADLAGVAAAARAAGHEIWLQAPMEGVAGAEPGPHTLTTKASEAETLDSLRWLMGRFAGYVGVENYLGAKFTADAGALSPALAEVGRRGLLFLDDGSSPLSKVSELAPALDLRAGRADVIAAGDPLALDAALARAEEFARRRGAVIVVATALPAALDHLAPWAAALEAKGFALIPVSTLVKARPDRSASAAP